MHALIPIARFPWMATVVCALLLAPWAAWAQVSTHGSKAAAQPPATTASAGKPPAGTAQDEVPRPSRYPRLTVVQSGFAPEHPLGAMEFRAEVANLTHGTITLRKLLLCLPSGINEARGAADRCEAFNCAQGNGDQDRCQVDEKLLAGQESEKYHRTASISPLHNWHSAGLLFFRAGSYEYRASLVYDDASGQTRQVHSVGKLDLKAPFPSLLAGAWTGSLLAALFYLANELRTASAANQQRALLPTAGKAVGIAFAGLVSSLIAVAIVARVQELPLPMNVAVTDFFGGFILGLGSYSLADWLAKKILP